MKKGTIKFTCNKCGYVWTVKASWRYLQLGYTKNRLEAWITRIEVVDGKNTDLAIDKPVYAIHLADVKECV